MHAIRFYYWFTRTYFNYALGHWFVFRNAPGWFVREIMEHGPEDDQEDEHFTPYVRQAREEWELRAGRLVARLLDASEAERHNATVHYIHLGESNGTAGRTPEARIGRVASQRRHQDRVGPR
jgi:hypothetical protein